MSNPRLDTERQQRKGKLKQRVSESRSAHAQKKCKHFGAKRSSESQIISFS